jgi:hypothetical protein
MLKLCIIGLILVITFCCPVGLSAYTYIGPYEVSFNSTAHPVSFISYGPTFEWFKDKNDQWDTTSTYEGLSTLNNSTTIIYITEGVLTNTLINNLTSLAPPEGLVKLQELDRVIDGHDATVAKYKTATGGWPSQIAVIVLPVKFEDYDYDKKAVINIFGLNYTDYEFDRLLDTFRINRLISD